MYYVNNYNIFIITENKNHKKIESCKFKVVFKFIIKISGNRKLNPQKLLNFSTKNLHIFQPHQRLNKNMPNFN